RDGPRDQPDAEALGAAGGGVVGDRIDVRDVVGVAVGRVVDALVADAGEVGRGPGRATLGLVAGAGGVGGVGGGEGGGVAGRAGVHDAVAVHPPDLDVKRGEQFLGAEQDLVDVAAAVAADALEGADAVVRVAVEVQVQGGQPGVPAELLGELGHVGD